MVSEQVCLDIIRLMHGRTCVFTTTLHLTDPPTITKSQDENAVREEGLIRPLLRKYDLSAIDAAIRWLRLGGYLGRTEYGLRGPWAYVLSDKALRVAESGCFPDEERQLFNLVEPHAVFLAHQFCDADRDLEQLVRVRLTGAGYAVWDGKVDGLEPFRHAILQKITKARFFLCLLTHRSELKAGGFVSSVWLYQEIGAAVATGKAPLLLVEDGMDSHYAGELQKTYEYIPFTRGSLEDAMPEVIRRFNVDLERNAIPLPQVQPDAPV
jgi:hypothetical protein